MKLRVAMLAAAASLAGAAPASADTFRVTSFGDTISPPGCTPSTAPELFNFDCTTLRGAVNTANGTPAEDTIMLDSGTYAVNAGVLVLSQDTVVSGVGARSTTVEGNGSDRVFATGGSANATLASMTIRGGFSAGSGGNIAVASGTELGLVFARVTGGVALRGAGVLNEGTLNVTNSLIDGNTAQIIGGGIDNVAIDGPPAELLVGESTIANNYAAEGAGISSRGTTQNDVSLVYATIARNTGGSGVYFQELQQTLTVGTILAANATESCTGNGSLSGSFNVDSGDSCGLPAGTNRVNADPQLAATLSDQGGGTNVLTIPADSLAANYVTFCPGGLDQRGWSRPQGACDAGAFDREAVDPGGGGGGGGGEQPPPTLTPTPVPPAQPTPTPTPVVNRTIVADEVRGTVKVQLPGTKTFVDLDATRGIPTGSIVDTRKGAVELTSVPRAGAPPEKATFYDGLFKVTQRAGITDLALVEKLDCPKGRKAAFAQKGKKPKKRKLWGEGKGAFRTSGRYSAATVRGTKWLVEDSCTTTTVRVKQGSVLVLDKVKNKRIVLRAPKTYIARAKK